MKKILSALISAAMVLASASPAFAADSAELNISADKIGHEVSPTLYGAFIEDISKAGDGGLVSNLVYNNSFEYNDTAEENAALNEAYWEFSNITHTLASDGAMNKNNPNYEKLTVSGKGVITNLGCVEDWDYKTLIKTKKLSQHRTWALKKVKNTIFQCISKTLISAAR